MYITLFYMEIFVYVKIFILMAARIIGLSVLVGETEFEKSQSLMLH